MMVQIAARKSRIELVKYLLGCGADPNTINDNGE